MNEATHEFRSAILGNERTLWILEPTGGAANPDLLLMLDGDYYRQQVGAPQIIEALRDSGAIAEALVVYVSHGDIEARWRECPCYPPFAAFVTQELMPWLEARYPFLKESQERIIAGVSYTGLAASYVALEAAPLFSKVISHSGSYWSEDGRLTRELEKKPEPVSISFFLDVGDRETDIDVVHKEDVIQRISQIEGVERFRDVLVSKGAEVEYCKFRGGHNAEGWRGTLPRALTWALPPETQTAPAP